IAAAELLKEEFGVTSDVWSATSFNELCRDGQDVDRWNLLNAEKKPRKSYVAQLLDGRKGPTIASTDYVRTYAEQIRPFVPLPYYTLGTDGFGRSDNRPALRDFFEVDRRWITVKALRALADQKLVPAERVSQAIKLYGIRPDRAAPWTV
ncbi:MAG: transketolase-like TK C-terminal-containing protein, partial [Panacagrimonas sp.]